MTPYSFKEIESFLKGKILQGDSSKRFTEVSIDSRQARGLFFAMVGARSDGHEFLVQAQKGGAQGVVIEKDMDLSLLPKGFPVLKVPSTVDALQRLASRFREDLDTKVIGITGSVGKTATKDFVAGVLSQNFTTYKNPGNLNTHIGLPLALLSAHPCEYTILEMGMRKRGEISDLCRIAEPEIGIVTDISPSHVGVLGSLEEIALAKAELLEYLPEEGLAVLRGDNPKVREIGGKAKCSVVYYGMDESCQYRPLDILGLGDKGSRFSVAVNGVKEEFQIEVPGRHQVENAMAAVALGLELGISADKIRKGLQNAEMSPMRMEIIHHKGVTIINDAYNASPKSVESALDLLAELQGSRKIAVLGDMLELGEYEIRAHREIGAYALGKADHLLAIGELGAYIRESWVSDGGYVPLSMWFLDKDDAAQYLLGFMKEGDVILVKASRSIGLESIVEAITFCEEPCREQ